MCKHFCRPLKAPLFHQPNLVKTPYRARVSEQKQQQQQKIIVYLGLDTIPTNNNNIVVVVVVFIAFPPNISFRKVYTCFLSSVQPNAHSEPHHVQFIFFDCHSYCNRCFNLKSSSICIYFLCRFFFSALHIIQRKYDWVHSILAINISRFCLCLCFLFCSSLFPLAERREKKWNRCVDKAVQ